MVPTMATTLVFSFTGQFVLFKMTSAAITPGTQPQKVKSSTIKKEPQPFPITERGGKIMANKTLQKLIFYFLIDNAFQHIDVFYM